MAVAFEIRMCSNRNAPTGMMPVSECSLRKRNEYPRPARSGATPFTARSLTAGAGLAVVASGRLLATSEVPRELFIIGAGEKGSQGRGGMNKMRSLGVSLCRLVVPRSGSDDESASCRQSALYQDMASAISSKPEDQPTRRRRGSPPAANPNFIARIGTSEDVP